MIAAAPSVRVVLYEGAGTAPLAESERFELMRALLEQGITVSRSLTGGTVTAGGDGTTLVLGRFTADPPSPPAPDLRLHNVEGLAAAEVVDLVQAAREEAAGGTPARWKPWFPVIDYDRCTNCMQCLSFCLFDVYGVQDGRITVQNQNKCKTDCPACSRVCPEVAILFPKYRSGPINGDEIDPEDLRREAMKVDISALLGGDIYQALRDRSARAKSRFSKERDEDRALKERMRCLAKLQQEMDIPPEVLASLPGPDEIAARAEAAQARAEAARNAAPDAAPNAAAEAANE